MIWSIFFILLLDKKDALQFNLFTDLLRFPADNNSGERFTFRINTLLSNGTPDALRVEVKDGYATANTALLINQWHHAAVVWDPVFGAGVHDSRIYLNGVLVGGDTAGWSGQSGTNQAINTAQHFIIDSYR